MIYRPPAAGSLDSTMVYGSVTNGSVINGAGTISTTGVTYRPGVTQDTTNRPGVTIPKGTDDRPGAATGINKTSTDTQTNIKLNTVTANSNSKGWIWAIVIIVAVLAGLSVWYFNKRK